MPATKNPRTRKRPRLVAVANAGGEPPEREFPLTGISVYELHALFDSDRLESLDEAGDLESHDAAVGAGWAYLLAKYLAVYSRDRNPQHLAAARHWLSELGECIDGLDPVGPRPLT